jgi:hypothetical protein
LWEELGLRLVGYYLLRKVFGSKGDEITGEGRRIHSEELYDIYS